MIWEHFKAMNLRRGSSGFGLNPISSAEIAAWTALSGVVIDRFEFEALERIEAHFLIAQAKKGEGEARGPAAEAPSGEIVNG